MYSKVHLIPVFSLLACTLTQEQPIDNGPRPCPTETRSPLAGGAALHDAEGLVVSFNARGTADMVFAGENTGWLGAEAQDQVTFTLLDDWSAERVTYADPQDSLGGAHCPEAGERLEVHGTLQVASVEGLALAFPVLLSGRTNDAADAALYPWSADIEAGTDEIDGPSHSQPFRGIYATIAEGYLDKLTDTEAGVWFATDADLAGSLGEGATLTIDAMQLDTGEGARVSPLLRGSLTW